MQEGMSASGARRVSAATGASFRPTGAAFDSRGTLLASKRDVWAFDEDLERLWGAVREAGGREQSWLTRVRAGLVALLELLDGEPVWQRLLGREASGADVESSRRERLVVGVFAELLSAPETRAVPVALIPILAPLDDLVAGGVFAVIRARMLEREHGAHGADGPLVELAPDLMAFIALPYLGRAAARAELEGLRAIGQRNLPELSACLTARRREKLPISLTRRTLLVLRAISQAPGSSNREIALAAGIRDEGQASKLLRRLREHGLVEKVGAKDVHTTTRNSWLLTEAGQRTLAHPRAATKVSGH